MSTVFAQIIEGKIPCDKVYEDENFIAFHDLYPQAPVHILVVPKKPLKNLAEAKESDALLIGKALLLAAKLAKQFGIAEGYRIITNSGAGAGQTIFHLHFHVLGGRVLDEHMC